jgi:flagellin
MEDFIMGLRVNTNLNALNTRLNLGKADMAQMRSLERLSTGLRINRAADDPGGLAASQQYRARIDGINQAISNAEQAQSSIATAESALGKIADLILKVRESAMYALNEGGITSEELAAEQAAVDNAIASIDRIAKTTRFGSKGLLNGQSGYVISNGTPANIADVGVYAANFTGPYAAQSNITMIVNQTLSGERASAVVTGLT